jgi:ribosomal protein S18 acetylase RimI-like enzyme
VIAERGGPVGAAWFRRFDAEGAQLGFVSDDVPELAIGVNASIRGVGVGRMLMDALIARAWDLSAPGLSLHVDARNTRALRLYRSGGFVEQRTLEGGLVMLLANEGAGP